MKELMCPMHETSEVKKWARSTETTLYRTSTIANNIKGVGDTITMETQNKENVESTGSNAQAVTELDGFNNG
jgi:hypothetical protein